MSEQILTPKQIYRKKYYAENKEKHKKTVDRLYYEKYQYTRKVAHKANPAVNMLRAAKQRAKKKGLEFTIKLSHIVIPEVCPILGLKLESNNGLACANSPSLDRIDSSRGYTKENIQVISWRANDIKKDSTVEELKKILKYLESI